MPQKKDAKVKEKIIDAKTIITWVGSIALSYVGGYFFLTSWTYFYSPVSVPESDVLSIANTYIVFTTIIFVGFSVLLVVGGIFFSHQFSQSKEEQTVHLFNEMEQLLKENKDDFGNKFIDKALENIDVKRYLETKLNEKFEQLKDEKDIDSEGNSTEDIPLSELAENINDIDQQEVNDGP